MKSSQCCLSWVFVSGLPLIQRYLVLGLSARRRVGASWSRDVHGAIEQLELDIAELALEDAEGRRLVHFVRMFLTSKRDGGEVPINGFDSC